METVRASTRRLRRPMTGRPSRFRLAAAKFAPAKKTMRPVGLAFALVLVSSSASTSRSKNSRRDSLVFLGTGASTALPDLRCISSGRPCQTCQRASRMSSRNRRGNVSVLLKMQRPGEAPTFVVIDVGKTFREGVLRFFRRHGVKQLEHVVLTHDHADAMLGLDDLRSVQGGARTHVHCDAKTFRRCSQAFPYLLPAGQRRATTRRFVSKVAFRVFHGPFSAGNVDFTPLPVWHGKGYLCNGFAWGPPEGRVVYLSDYTSIPEDIMSTLHSWAGTGEHGDNRRIRLMILDAQAWDNDPRVHASLMQSLALARQLRAREVSCQWRGFRRRGGAGRALGRARMRGRRG